jgi:hypothetical protein
MNEDIENQLRRAMRPVEPPAGFAERVMRALPERRPATVTAITTRTPRSMAPANLWQRFATPAALAASLVVALVSGQHFATENFKRQQREGMAASRELMQALRVTSQKLDLAYQAVQDPVPPSTDTHAEENRS